ncbi:MAG: prepilin-type N-terminal cleavage/methylation domain-containing protein [Verrucomicrobiae bacterium]|nr:prepilin-type N-terminal cleavage/methylation domain-containing protein [Verrucomicrobiae bacterium]
MPANLRTPHRSRRGFSLTEVLLALTLFAFLALALASGLIVSRKLAESSVYESTAIGVASGYLEQMKGMVYADLVAALPGGTPAGSFPR